MPNRLPTLFVPSVADTTPRAWSFIKEIVDSVNCLTLCFSRDYTFTVSKYNLHSNLTDLCLPYPSTVPLLGTDRAKTMPVSPSTNSFFFKLHTNNVPVRTWLDIREFLFLGQ